MKKLVFSVALMAIGATTAQAQEAIVQIGPTTPYSTIDCRNFASFPDGVWRALRPVPFGLGFVHGIIPPPTPFKAGYYIYNNIDLASQLKAQCGAGPAPVVRARY